MLYQQQESGTGLGVPYSGTELVPASVFLFISVPDWPDAGQSGILVFKKRQTPCTSTLQAKDWDTPCTLTLLVVKGYIPCTSILLAVEEDTPWTFIDGCWWCYSCYMMLKHHVYWKCRNAWKKLVRHRHSGSLGQSSTACRGLVRHCPAMVINVYFVCRPIIRKLSRLCLKIMVLYCMFLLFRVETGNTRL